MPGLVANGSSAQFTGQVPGNVTIGVTYTTPGKKLGTSLTYSSAAKGKLDPDVGTFSLFSQADAIRFGYFI